MHGLINRSIQCFVRDTYGHAAWDEIVSLSGLEFQNFEALMNYPDELSFRVLGAAGELLGKPRDMLLEDMGTYLVSHPNLEPIRRLLRFGGEDFLDFLYSLDDLPDRARLAVSDLELPQLEIRDHSPGILTLRCWSHCGGFGHVMVGVLRAMADDYGSLAMLEHLGRNGDEEVISVQLLEAGFAKGRDFNLAPGSVANAGR